MNNLKLKSESKFSIFWGPVFGIDEKESLDNQWDKIEPHYISFEWSFFADVVIWTANKLINEVYEDPDKFCLYFNRYFKLLWHLSKIISRHEKHKLLLTNTLEAVRNEPKFKELNTAANRARLARWRSKNRAHYNEYMREYKSTHILTPEQKDVQRARHRIHVARSRLKIKIKFVLES